MEPTSLIYLPDGTVLDPDAVAVIRPASDRYVYYRLLGTPGPLSIETKTPEHAAEIMAYMVACKELATSPRETYLDGDVHLPMTAAAGRARAERLSRAGNDSRTWANARVEAEPRAFDVMWAEWWSDREDFYAAHPDEWLNDAKRVCRHFFDEGARKLSRADDARLDEDEDDEDDEPSLEDVHSGLCEGCYAYVVEMGFVAPKG